MINIARKFKLPKNRIFVICACLILSGAVLLAQSALPSFKFEGEAGTLGQQAFVGADASASGGSYLGFITAPPAGVQFSEDFSSPNSVNRFVYQRIHGSPTHDHTDADPFEGIDQDTINYTYMGDHDMNCGNPNLTKRGPIGFEPSTAPLRTFQQINTSRVGNPDDQTVWYCAPGDDPGRAHMMTGLTTFAYAHLDFMPNQTFQDVRKICFDVNWSEMGGRKWMQVAVVPESYFQANNSRMSYALPSLEGDGNVAVKAVLVRNGTFLYSAFRSSMETITGGASSADGDQSFGSGFNDGSRYHDKAPRFTNCIEDVGNNQIRISRPNFPNELGGPETRTMRGRFPDGQARVIFQDVTYDGPKGDNVSDDMVTWHWDNILIE